MYSLDVQTCVAASYSTNSAISDEIAGDCNVRVLKLFAVLESCPLLSLCVARQPSPKTGLSERDNNLSKRAGYQRLCETGPGYHGDGEREGERETETERGRRG